MAIFDHVGVLQETGSANSLRAPGFMVDPSCLSCVIYLKNILKVQVSFTILSNALLYFLNTNQSINQSINQSVFDRKSPIGKF
jgi:hypothetical protein